MTFASNGHISITVQSAYVDNLTRHQTRNAWFTNGQQKPASDCVAEFETPAIRHRRQMSSVSNETKSNRCRHFAADISAEIRRRFVAATGDC